MAIFIDTARDPGELTLDRESEPGWSSGHASLTENATAAAPLFCDALLANLRRSQLPGMPPEGELEPLRGELQSWLVGLFKPLKTEFQELSPRQPQPKRYELPLSFLLHNLGLILRFGREVAALSPQSDDSLHRFMSALSAELANKQVDVERRLDYLSTLILLD